MSHSFLKPSPSVFMDTNGVLNLSNSVLFTVQGPKTGNSHPVVLAVTPQILQMQTAAKPNIVLNGINIQNKVCDEPERPLGSSENPIEIIQDGETLRSTQNLSKSDLQLIADALKRDDKLNATDSDSTTTNFVYRVVYPEELNLKPINSKQNRRGRPKKRPIEETKEEDAVKDDKEQPLKSARTRSGRITRPPRHIEQDFKKIDVDEFNGDEDDLNTTEFTPLTTSHNKNGEQTKVLNSLDNHQKKRNISSRYRCPKCQKAYLGRSRMLRHLQDFPDHGPIPEHCKDNNFETWNFLVDITQKSTLSNKGRKFCEELTNLLHNVKLLAKVLFKATNEKKHTVKIDRVLGNALDLKPGDYKFNENELHKDVTIMSLLENSKFFEDTYLNTNEITEENRGTEHQETTTNLEKQSADIGLTKQATITNTLQNNDTIKSETSLGIVNEGSAKYPHNVIKKEMISFHDKLRNEVKNEDSIISLHNELLTENSLLNSLPSLKNSVDDLIIPGVDSGQMTSLLDNSTSSDEVMNVDQFVNERFKNITEPEIDPLALDLPTLDLFQFRDS